MCSVTLDSRQYIAVGESAWDGAKIQFIDVLTGDIQKELTGHEMAILDVGPYVDSSTSSSYIVSCSPDTSIRVYDLNNWNQQTVWKYTDRVLGVCVGSKSGVVAAATYDDNVLLLPKLISGEDASSDYGLMKLKGHKKHVTRVRYQQSDELSSSSDDSFLFSSSYDGSIIRWDVNQQQEEKNMVASQENGDPVQYHDISVNTSNSLVVGGSSDNKIRIWDYKSGKLSHNIIDNQHTDFVLSVSFATHDLNLFYSGSKDKTVRCWDLRMLSPFSTSSSSTTTTITTTTTTATPSTPQPQHD
eukprot:TRINITY_DN7057_c0_g1_i2.p1 TRINITY_DN7057_c0_g1~~TRINITY_DN7057_c0_g1_i2.p1  ORF type:complete len:300 (-),score=74.97 TRINITY_DN7057_c0_g1_i2:112-1011(-)